MTRILMAVLLCALTACGGSSGDSYPAPATVAGCTPRVVSVALLGDSTQYGLEGGSTNDANLAPHNPGVELQNQMDLRFGVGAVVVTDYGQSGSIATWSPKVSGDVIVANYGINDMRLAQSQAETLDDYKAAMIATGATLIETQNPILDRSWPEAKYVEAAKSLGISVADVNAYDLALPKWEEMLGTIGVHPDDALYILEVDNVLAPSVALQVAPLRCVVGES